MQLALVHLWGSSIKGLKKEETLRGKLLGPGSAAKRGRIWRQGIQGGASWAISTNS